MPYEVTRLKRCLVCNKMGADRHHLRTRGAGGSDDDGNIISLCRQHHTMCHQIGLKTFVERFKLKIDVSGIYPKKKGE